MGSHTGIRTNLLSTTAVIVTVLLALFMSRQDGSDGDSLLAVLVETVIPADTGVKTTPTAILLPTTTAAAPEGTETAVVVADAGEKTAVSLLPRCENPPAHWLPHTVRNGETIYSLSISSGATAAEIRQANCLAMEQSLTGLTIYLPPQPPTRTPCGPPSYWQPQLIYAGDTLYGLAVRYGTTVYAIMQANCLGSSYLMVGRRLYLPPVVVVTAVLPTATPTIVPPTATATIGLTVTPIITSTITPAFTPTIVPTSTVTAVPSPTFTPTQPPITPTIPATGTPLSTVTPSPTVVATETAVFTPTSPPTAIPTATPLPPTASATP